MLHGQTHGPDPMGPGPIAAFLAICFIWGSTFLAIRVAVETLPPFLMIALRCLIAGPVLMAFSLWRGNALPGPAGIRAGFLSGTLMFLCGQAMLALGETRLDSGHAAVVNATLSLFMPLASWLLGTARAPGQIAAFGLVLGFAGVVVLANPAAGRIDPVGFAIVQCSAISFAFGTATARRWRPAQTAAMSSGLQMLCGGLVTLAASLAMGEWRHFDPALVSWRSVLALGYLTVMGSMVAFAAFGWLVQIWRPERLAPYTYVNPVVALMIGSALAGEAIGWREWLATAMILGAVAVVMLGNRARS